ncbi:hypothetical protein K0U27_02720 [archaeon]|nr:hypothetical protein [archaeon]
MTYDTDCSNCTHLKNDHRLMLGRSGGGDFLPGTSMPSGNLESSICCTKCTCCDYVPVGDVQNI